MALKHKASEEVERRKTSESWHGEACGFDFRIDRDSEGRVSMTAQPTDYRDRGKLTLFCCYPKHVDDIERFADEMPRVFKAIAAEMREAGLIDLRSRWDRQDDALKLWREKMEAAVKAGKPIPQFEPCD